MLCAFCDPSTLRNHNGCNYAPSRMKGNNLCPEIKEGCQLRLGIDARGNLFWRKDGTRWRADPEDNDLTELKSILLEAKPRGGSFIVAKGRVHYRTTDGTEFHAEHVVLWFDPKESKWIPPMSLSQKWDAAETEAFIGRFSHSGRTN